MVTHDAHNLVIQPDLFKQVEHDLVDRPVCRYEELQLPSGEKLRLSFGGAKIGYVRKNHNRLTTYKHGKGQIIWSGLPLELSDSPAAIYQTYRQMLEQAGIESRETQAESPLLVARKPLKDGTLILIVSESAECQQLTLAEANIQVEVAANRAGAVIVKEDASFDVFGGLTVL